MSGIRYLTLAILLLSVSVALGQLVPVEKWVARYNGPGNGADLFTSLAIDSQGNVYVTGQSWGGASTYSDYATVKYDSAGNQLWISRYNGPQNYWDRATAVAVDAQGNVCVTGTLFRLLSHSDYTTIKYDSGGNQLWVAPYNGPGNWDDYARDLAVDAGGNVYVTGESCGSGTADDYATIKYDPDGNQLWVARYNYLGYSWDFATALAVDAEGNVYVTGESQRSGSGTYRDYATVKYDSDGNQLWVARYNGPGSAHDYGYALAVDAFGYVYVTGRSANSVYEPYNYDYATLKYDSQGHLLWVARYNGPGNSDDEAFALAVDSEGNLYVTGRSYGSRTRFDYATIKYNSNGNELWVARYSSPGGYHDEATALAVDTSGNVYVTGQSWGGSGTSYDYVTLKYDSEGSRVWMVRYNGPGNGGDEATALAVDASANVYVTGHSEGSGTDYDYLTIKYVEIPRPEIAVSITPYNPPIVIPPEGGYFSFDGIVTNDEDTSVVVDAWSMVSLPTGHRRGPKVLIEDIYLAPHHDTLATFTHRVKRFAPPGEYTYVGYVGYYPDTKLDSSYFHFTKLGGGEIPSEELSLVFDIFGEEVESESPVTALLGAYPSPFNLQTNIAYNLVEDSQVRLEVFDLMGRKAATLVDSEQPAGRHSVMWEASGQASGVYFCKLTAGDFTEVRRMTLLK